MLKSSGRYPHVVSDPHLWAEKTISALPLFSHVGFLGAACVNEYQSKGPWRAWRVWAVGAVLYELFLPTSSPIVSLYEWARFLQQFVAIAQRSQPFLLVVDNKPSEKMFSSGVIFACGFNGGEGWGERQGSSPVIVRQKWQNCWLERAWPEPCIETQKNNWKCSGLSWCVRTGLVEICVASSVKDSLEKTPKKYLALSSLKLPKYWGSSWNC